MAAKIKKGDKVIVLTGKDKGKTGTVTQVIPSETRAIVQGVNLVRRHTRQTAERDAGIYTKEAPIHLSNTRCSMPGQQADPRRLQDRRRREEARRCPGEVIDGRDIYPAPSHSL